MTSANEPPPTGTKYDGLPQFEALVFGWACSENGWNGEKPLVERTFNPSGVDELHPTDREKLAGYFEQYLDQQAAAVPTGGSVDPLPAPAAVEATVEYLAALIRRHVSLDPAEFRASTLDAARAFVADACAQAQR